MNTIECTTLAGSLMKTRGNFWMLNQVTRRPKALVRLKHDPCEPAHISWQWLAKSSPDVQKCHQLTLKKKVCPKKRFLPRLRRGFIHKDILACEPEKKPLSWSEYFSFLLPDEITQKPPMATCRKLLEHRRRKCLAPEDYQRCVTGECWPLPTEWYGQGVMHISQLALTSPPRKAVEKIQHCPPPAHMLAKCSKVKLPECPTPKCSDESPRRMPYLQFRGADTDGSPPTLSVKCLVKHNPDLLPHPQNLDKSVKISCRNYGEFKAVDCPKQMFNRYMNVDFNTKNLLPIPTTSTEYTPLREVKKGVCERQTLLRPPSIRNFSTGRPLMLKDFPEFIKPANTNHLQPGSSAFRSEKLIERAGMDVDLLHKPLNERSSDGHRLYWFTEEELNKHELEAQRAEETTQEKQKRLDAQKSKLQVLVDKQNSEGAKNSDGKPVRAKGPNEEPGRRKLFGGMVDLEEVPYQRSGFHFSATQLARKSNDRTKGSKSSKNDDKICSGCPGIHGEEAEAAKVKTRCNVLKGGIRGRCKVERPPEPNGRPNRLTMKCKPQRDSPCMRPRPRVCEQKFENDLPCQFGSKNKRKFHTTNIFSEKMSAEVRKSDGKNLRNLNADESSLQRRNDFRKTPEMKLPLSPEPSSSRSDIKMGLDTRTGPSYAARSAASIHSTAVLDKWKSLSQIVGDGLSKDFNPLEVAKKSRVSRRNPMSVLMERLTLTGPKSHDTIQKIYDDSAGQVRNNILRIFKDRYHGGAVGEKEPLETLAKDWEIESRQEKIREQVENRRDASGKKRKSQVVLSKSKRKPTSLEKNAVAAYVATEMRKNSLYDVRGRYFDQEIDRDSKTERLQVKFVNDKFIDNIAQDDDSPDAESDTVKNKVRGLETLRFFQDKYTSDSDDSVGSYIIKNELVDNEKRGTFEAIKNEQQYKRQMISAQYNSPFNRSQGEETDRSSFNGAEECAKVHQKNKDSTKREPALSKNQSTTTVGSSKTPNRNSYAENQGKTAQKALEVVTKRSKPTPRRSMEKPRLRGITLESKNSSTRAPNRISGYNMKNPTRKQPMSTAGIEPNVGRLVCDSNDVEIRPTKNKIPKCFISEAIPGLLKMTNVFERRFVKDEKKDTPTGEATTNEDESKQKQEPTNPESQKIEKDATSHSGKCAAENVNERNTNSHDKNEAIGFHMASDAQENSSSDRYRRTSESEGAHQTESQQQSKSENQDITSIKTK